MKWRSIVQDNVFRPTLKEQALSYRRLLTVKWVTAAFVWRAGCSQLSVDTAVIPNPRGQSCG
jgi:hypothetical protein